MLNQPQRRRPMHRPFWLGLLVCALTLVFFTAPCISSQPSVAKLEYQVKAVFLLNLAKFTEWPEQAFTNDAAPFVIGIVGDNPFGPILEQALAGETIKNRDPRIRHFKDNEPIAGCQMLFISRSEAERAGKIQHALQGCPVMTVGDGIAGFVEGGGIINFVFIGKNVGFEVNPTMAESAGLKISAKLLSLPKAIKKTTTR